MVFSHHLLGGGIALLMRINDPSSPQQVVVGGLLRSDLNSVSFGNIQEGKVF
ncbi:MULTISPECIES: hypothetical protein [Candidatus Ichthyocystis]|uniref:hypothetical protein n=1 Tax=Candidatus Ichthyocystis TaxID=2929841 RepID=UPI0012FE1798|nr:MULTISPECIES: hypothetical protein [Ichthyocystis]